MYCKILADLLDVLFYGGGITIFVESYLSSELNLTNYEFFNDFFQGMYQSGMTSYLLNAEQKFHFRSTTKLIVITLARKIN